MAKKTRVLVTIIDDLDGTEIAEDEAHEVFFGYKGSQYRLDLSKANADKLDKLINPYIAAAERISSARGRPRGSGTKRPDTGSGRPKEELANIREWLKKNGHEVNPRGRIKADLLEAYDEAHAS
jgi:hypothetical protein